MDKENFGLTPDQWLELKEVLQEFSVNNDNLNYSAGFEVGNIFQSGGFPGKCDQRIDGYIVNSYILESKSYRFCFNNRSDINEYVICDYEWDKEIECKSFAEIDIEELASSNNKKSKNKEKWVEFFGGLEFIDALKTALLDYNFPSKTKK